MPCGKRPLKKNWDKPRNLRTVKTSKYEKNEPSVKLHWREVIRNLELSYKDDKFWETQRETVEKLVGPVIFPRIAEIFNIPPDFTQYEPPSETASRVASDQYYLTRRTIELREKRPEFSYTDYEPSTFELKMEEESEQTFDQWSEDTLTLSINESLGKKKSSRKNIAREPSQGDCIKTSRNFSRMICSKSFSQRMLTSTQSGFKKIKSELTFFTDSPAFSEDDMDVHLATIYGLKRAYNKNNPHYDMLYCNESETDMIKWNSKYKQKAFEISASDEFSKRAEILTKTIAKEFIDWWSSIGSNEYRSEVKRPEDIEDLFQVWFDEHASRCLKLDPKILPCVLPSIANYVIEPQASCPRVLKRQIAHDVHAETKPAHITAFDTSLPHKLKHIPPKNNTKEMWHCVKIPEDLKSMAAVWDDIQHLTSTKKFAEWLKQRPHLSMPPCLDDTRVMDKKQLFIVPSDFVMRDIDSNSGTERGLALPVSEYSMELQTVISKLMN